MHDVDGVLKWHICEFISLLSYAYPTNGMQASQ